MGDSGSIRKRMPRPLNRAYRTARRFKKEIEYFSLDLKDFLTGKRGELTPPRKMWNIVGGDDFNKIGRQFLGYFIDLAVLKPEDHVLDLGCGIGRMAVPLTKYLDPSSVYEGLDVDAKSID